MNAEIVAALIGVFAGFVVTYFGAVVKFRNDLRFEYDRDLRDERLKVYPPLWQLTEAFPKYARTQTVTIQDAQTLTVALRDWYYRQGGMFLSDKSRGAYFALQDALTLVLSAQGAAP